MSHAQPTFSLVESMRTAGGSGTVPISNGSGALAMGAPTPASHAASHAGAGGDPVTSLGAFTLTGNITQSGARTWTLADNEATALSFDTAGLAGMLVLTTTDGAERLRTNAPLFQLAGTTSAFPALKRNGAGIDVRLADDSAYGYLSAYHVGINVAPTATHMLYGSELFAGTATRQALGFFPTYKPDSAATNILYGVQGNIFFGTSNWGAGSNVNALQFFPAPDYSYGSTAFGSASLNLIGITTGAVINVLTKPITAASLTGLAVGTLSHIFGGPGVVDADTATAIKVVEPSQTAGTIGVQTGILVDPQLHATTNRGVWLAGDDAGCDLLFGAGAQGVGDSFSKVGSTITLTDAAGLFTAAMVGKNIVISGATSPGNNGSFAVTQYVNPTVIRWTNASGVAQAFPGKWYVSTTPNARIVYDGANLIVNPAFSGSGRVYIGPTGNQNMLLNNIEIDGELDHDGGTAGFYGTAPIAKPTITGAKAGNAALTSLCSQLAALGLITDSTT